jgi:hypothetical protein
LRNPDIAEIFLNRRSATTIEQVLANIFDEYLWFLDLSSSFPGRFFYFFEHGFGEDVLRKMARFLTIESGRQWIQDSTEVFETRSPYQHPKNLVQFYSRCVENKFCKHPEFAENLLAFL